MLFSLDTIQRLKKSIKKWEDIAYNNKTDSGAEDCPLCEKFNNAKDCKIYRGVCPVAYFTGYHWCRNTPFTYWYEHHEKKHNNTNELIVRKVECKTCQYLAMQELDFLKLVLRRSIIFINFKANQLEG